MLALENLVFPLGALGVVAAFALSARRAILGGLGSELAERLGRGPKAEPGRPTVWVHAASAGEVAAAAPLLAALAARPSRPFILLTTMTAAGRARAAGLPGLGAAALAPLDAWPCVARFLSRAAPRAVLLLETELWPHIIALSARRGLPVFLVNGRVSARSFPRYRMARPLVAAFMGLLSRVCAQSQADAERLIALGSPSGRTSVAGNLKFDAGGPQPALEQARRRVRELSWEGAPLFVAGSTHPGEEEIVVEAFLTARARHPGARLVIAPRHVERAAQTAAVLERGGLSFRRWTQPAGAAGADALILDALGALSAFYPLARLSFVGGTLAPVGGHNVLEPALASSPVAFGPHTQNTQEPAALLAAAGGAFRVRDAEELSRALLLMLDDPARAAACASLALRTAEGLRGAAARTLAALEDELTRAGV